MGVTIMVAILILSQHPEELDSMNFPPARNEVVYTKLPQEIDDTVERFVKSAVSTIPTASSNESSQRNSQYKKPHSNVKFQE